MAEEDAYGYKPVTLKESIVKEDLIQKRHNESTGQILDTMKSSVINDDDEDFDNDLTGAAEKKAKNKAEADKLVISDSTDYKEVPEDADGGDGEKKKSSCCFFIDIFHTYNTGFLVALGL